MSCCHNCAHGLPCAGTHPACPPGYTHVQTRHGPRCEPVPHGAPRMQGRVVCPPDHHLEPGPRGPVCVPNDDELASCEPLPWLGPQIAELTHRLLTQGRDDASRIAATVLARLYPVTRTNAPIDWQRLPANADPCLLELRRAVRAEVAKLVTTFQATAAQARYLAILRDRGAVQ